MLWNHRIHSFLPMQYMGADGAGRQNQNLQSEMKLRFRFGCLLIALGLSTGVVLPFAAQNRNENKPPQQQRQPQKQERRQQQGARGSQSRRPDVERSRSSVTPIRPTEMNTLKGANRPSNVRGESDQRPNFNPNRPPTATSPQVTPRRFQDLSPEEKRRVLRNQERFNRLSPQKQQEMREAAKNWAKLTTEQQNHIKNDLLPEWKQLPQGRRNAIKNRLGVLQNMPESARNRHLNDPNFTRGMSEEDKALLRDLSHMHVGAPDSPNE
jgi:hypothetical protein